MKFSSEKYKNFYNLNDNEIDFFQRFFSDDIIQRYLNKIFFKVIFIKFISFFLIIIIPLFFSYIFYIVYNSLGLDIEFFRGFLIFLTVFLFFGCMIAYVKLFAKRTFTKDLTNFVIESMLHQIDENLDYISKQYKDKKSVFYIHISDLWFYEDTKDETFTTDLSFFLGTYNNISKKGNLNLGEFTEEKVVKLSKFDSNSFIVKQLGIKEKENYFDQIELVGQEIKKKRELYYIGPKYAEMQNHSYFYKIKFKNSNISINNGIKLWRKGRMIKKDNYYLEILLFGMYLFGILYYIDLFVIELFGYQIIYYSYMYIGVIVLLFLYVFYVISIRLYAYYKNSKIDKSFDFYSNNKEESKDIILKPEFFDIINEFIENGIVDNRNYDFYLKKNILLIKYDIYYTNRQVDNPFKIYDTFIKIYLDNKNIVNFMYKISKFYYQ